MRLFESDKRENELVDNVGREEGVDMRRLMPRRHCQKAQMCGRLYTIHNFQQLSLAVRGGSAINHEAVLNLNDEYREQCYPEYGQLR